MTATAAPSVPKRASEAARRRALREWTDLVRLWAVCERAACRRARACRGDILRCAPEHVNGLPGGVQDFLVRLLGAKAQGLSFAEAIDGYAGSACERAMQAWEAHVTRLTGTSTDEPARRPPAGPR